MGEDDPWDGGVVGGAGFAEDGVGDDAGLVFGDVGEQRDTGDVADCPQPVGDAAVLVDGQRTTPIRGDAQLGQAQFGGGGVPSGAEHDHVGAHDGAVVEFHDGVVAVAVGGPGLPAGVDVDAVAAQLGGGKLAEAGLFAVEQPGAALDDGDLGAHVG